ncbi:MAG: DUF177 domain-containing protein, partial [Dehalococcoidia bacterium]|nr:DUF177 domain-containing protein [Dehalococcoidia bacterium]
RTDRGILVKGNLRTHVDTTCGRCLNSFSAPVTCDIEEEFFPKIDMLNGASLPPPPDPDTFCVDEHHILDLSEAVRQYALMTLPITLLCRSDCPGLCPECGHDLGEGPCTCHPTDRDSRLAKMEQLLASNGSNCK